MLPQKKLLKCNAVLYNATEKRPRMVTQFVEKFKDTEIRQLSGGQVRRLELCSALLLNPDILILDEPLSGLNDVSIVDVLDMLKSTAKQDNMAVLVTTHQPSRDALLNYFCKLITLEDGMIVCNTMVSKLWGGENECYQVHADKEVCDLLRGNMANRLRNFVDVEDTKADLKNMNETHLRCRKAINTASQFRQCIAIGQRLHAEIGIKVADIVRLPAVLVLLSIVFQFDKGSLAQLLFTVTFYVAAPVNVMR